MPLGFLIVLTLCIVGVFYIHHMARLERAGRLARSGSFKKQEWPVHSSLSD